MNKMKEILIDKVVLNIGVGQPGERLDNAKKLLEIITNRKAVYTKAKERNPTFKIRPGLPIGVKVTLRGKDAIEILKKAFAAVKNKISKRSIDKNGNFSIGIKEYIDFPGIKYMPEIGIMGFDVTVTLKRRGYRVMLRKRKTSKVGNSHRIKPDETIQYLKNVFGVEVK